MLVLGIDFETTGVNPQKDEPIEIACVLWDCKRDVSVALFSEFIKPNSGGKLSKEVQDITGISISDLETYGKSKDQILELLSPLWNKADFILGHYGIQFDRIVLERMLQGERNFFKDKSWIDTAYDLPFPDTIKVRKLSELAFEHDFIPMFKHRALFDVFTTLKIFSKYDLRDVLRYAKTPLLRAWAQVDYNERQKVKNLGFHWLAENRMWAKIIRKFEFKNTTFPVDVKTEVLYTPPG